MKQYFLKDFPDLNSFFLISGRHAGISTKLRGTAALVSVYLHSTPHSWSDSSKRQFEHQLKLACEWLEKEAKRYGTFLRIQPYVYDIPAPLCPDPMHGLTLLLQHFRASAVSGLQKHYESTLQVNEAPIQLAFDTMGRSFAYMQRGTASFAVCPEISHIFYAYQPNTWEAIAHELLHQFGAIDYYFPAPLMQSAQRNFGNSIMGIGTPEVDELTAYLIGWRDTVGADSIRFLRDVSYLTPELYEAERRRS